VTEAILVLNAGSSSIKFSLFGVGESGLVPEVHGQIEEILTAPRFEVRDASGSKPPARSWPQGAQPGQEGAQPGHEGALERILAFLREELKEHRLSAVGHRVVHGGQRFTGPVRVDAAVLESLRELIPLAPLHQPHNLSPMSLLLDRDPALPQVACFDTSFHRTNPDLAQRFALPGELHDAGVRRYGFHGLSYEHIASVLPRHDPKAAAGRTVALHLGNGSSLCAMLRGESVASTMGFTALDGVPMGTRCGSIDPGVVLYLLDERKMDARAVERLLYHQSGLLGVSGISSDMRALLASGDPRAALAVDLFVYRIRREIGSLAAAVGGLDALVFTGGIGENSAPIRARVCNDAGWLGIDLDGEANARGGPRISVGNSRVSAWVIPADEEMSIARHTWSLVKDGEGGEEGPKRCGDPAPPPDGSLGD
jgi:acetate kinase